MTWVFVLSLAHSAYDWDRERHLNNIKFGLEYSKLTTYLQTPVFVHRRVDFSRYHLLVQGNSG